MHGREWGGQRADCAEEPTERVPSVAARVVHRKARERAATKIIRGNTEIAKDLERQVGFTSRSRNLHDQIRALLMSEAAAALRQSDRIRPDDLRLEDPAKLFELDQARRAGLKNDPVT